MSPAFLEGGSQNRAKGRHFTAANTLSAFGRFNQGGGGGGGGGCSLLGRFNQWGGGGGGGGGGVLSLSASSINQVSTLSADSTSGRWRLCYRGGAHVYKQGGGPWQPLPPPGDAHEFREGGEARWGG